jgi:hypothetical protein
MQRSGFAIDKWDVYSDLKKIPVKATGSVGRDELASSMDRWVPSPFNSASTKSTDRTVTTKPVSTMGLALEGTVAVAVSPRLEIARIVS